MGQWEGGRCSASQALPTWQAGLPISGMELAAGGVESARRRSNTKKATKMFIPVVGNNQKQPKSQF